MTHKLLTPALAGIASVAVLGIGGVAQAATVSFSASQPITTTNYGPIGLSVPKFDPSLGTLTKATVSLSGTVQGNARAESLDAAPANVTLDLSALIRANFTAALGGGLIVDVVPLASQVFNASAFDGTIDFGGGSGVTYPALSATQSDSTMYTAPASLSLFIASFSGENITLNLTATGQSTGSGAGNLITQFATQAGGDLTVDYEYTETTPDPVPEPLTILGSLAAVGVGAALKKKQAA